MIQLVKGSWDSLEGRVVIYAKHAPREGEPGIFAIYNSIDLADFSEKTGIAQFDMLQMKEQNEAVRRQHGIPSYLAIPFVQPIEFDEKDAAASSSDILSVGSWLSEDTCKSMLGLGQALYFNKLNEQMELKYNLSRAAQRKSRQPEPFSGELTEQNICTHFVAPMLQYISAGNTEGFEALSQQLLALGSGKPYMSTIHDLLKELNGARRTRVIELEVRLLCSVGKEDYDSAAIFSRQLKEAKGADL